MKHIVLALLVVSLAGCGIELLTTTAIQGELNKQNMSQMKKALDHAQGTTSELGARQAIDAYYAEKGVYPESLEVLVPEWLPEVPKRPNGRPYGYDPRTGALLDGPVPPPRPAAKPQESDAEKMAKITDAVMKYATDKGYYPTSLWALVPDYLPDYLKANSGQEFYYDPQSGAVLPPDPLAESADPMSMNSPQSVPTGRVPAGGGGPLGEAMTGIAIQNELGRMNNSGASAARGRMKGGLGDATSGHNRQQEEALDALGQ